MRIFFWYSQAGISTPIYMFIISGKIYQKWLQNQQKYQWVCIFPWTVFRRVRGEPWFGDTFRSAATLRTCVLTSIAHGERTVTQHPSEPKATLLKSLLTLIKRKSQAQPKYIWSEQFNPPWASFWRWPSYAVSHQPQSKAANPWRVSGTNCRSDSLGSEKWSRAANQSLKTPNTTRLQRMLPKPAFIKLDCRKHKNIRSCSSISY